YTLSLHDALPIFRRSLRATQTHLHSAPASAGREGSYQACANGPPRVGVCRWDGHSKSRTFPDALGVGMPPGWTNCRTVSLREIAVKPMLGLEFSRFPMLRFLRISHLAVIDSVEVEFDAG